MEARWERSPRKRNMFMAGRAWGGGGGGLEDRRGLLWPSLVSAPDV